MSKHILIDGKYSRWNQKTNQREEYNSRDPEKSVIADLTEAELKSLGNRVKEVVEDKGPEDISQLMHYKSTTEVVEIGSSSTVADLLDNEPVGYSGLLSKSVSEIRSAIANISDLQVLNAIREEEVAGKQRLGVLKVIRSRQEELSK